LEKKQEADIEATNVKKKQEGENARIRDYENQKVKARKIYDHLKERQKIYKQMKLVTHVENRDKLISHHEAQEKNKQFLNDKKLDITNDIEENKKILAKLRAELKELKFSKRIDKKDTQEEVVVTEEAADEEDPYIEKVEADLNKAVTRLQDLETSNEKLYKLISGICTVISRIMFQLQKGKRVAEVKGDNVVEMLSACGLRLEKMLTIIVKKKKTFRIESINTDGTFDKPPDFLGLPTNKNRDLREKDEESHIDEDESESDEELKKEQHRIKTDIEQMKKEREEAKKAAKKLVQ